MVDFTDYLNHQRSQHKERENVTNGPIHGQISGLILGLAWPSQATPTIAVMNSPAFAPVPVAESLTFLS
jgi:hypothetical protein